ncbi:MAG: class Ib ribonucleoside-diphosphate reductase assembly flavoprotein NrdI [Clostridium sp.]|jgi:protein involved in ribonucleotide reduction|nr:class Ib ribonucleoside-diphosphate reductase assembly flavoprotein NrdI [Clostridium sp.]
MIIVYDSKTGLGKKFAEKLSCPTQSVTESVNSPCLLVTRNVGLGKIPKTTDKFLRQYHSFVKGVVVNGNRRYGRFFCAAGPKITEKYQIPVALNIEGEGSEGDVQKALEFLSDL